MSGAAFPTVARKGLNQLKISPLHIYWHINSGKLIPMRKDDRMVFFVYICSSF